jgi:beta-mannosidase
MLDTLTNKYYLNSNWEFTQIGGGQANSDGEWLKASKAITSVHVELLELKKIPDPFVGINEHEVQCKDSLNSMPRKCLD